MKKIIFLLCAFFSIQSAAEAKLVKLVTDQTSYSLGSKAVVFAYFDNPNDANMEFNLTLTMGGAPLKTVFLSPSVAVAFTAPLNTAGDFNIDGQVYLQDATKQASYDKQTLFFTSEVQGLQKELASEVDPNERAALQARIDRDQAFLNVLQKETDDNQLLVGMESMPIKVLASNMRAEAVGPGIFSLAADQTSYHVGQSANFFATLLTNFTGPDGVREAVWSGDIDGHALLDPSYDNVKYTFTSSAFKIADIGSHTLHAALSIRSKAQADLLRSTLFLATVQRDGYQKNLDASASPEDKIYYQYKINDLNFAITAINAQLQAILLPVTTGSLPFNVTATFGNEISAADFYTTANTWLNIRPDHFNLLYAVGDIAHFTLCAENFPTNGKYKMATTVEYVGHAAPVTLNYVVQCTTYDSPALVQGQAQFHIITSLVGPATAPDTPWKQVVQDNLISLEVKQ